MPPKSKIIKQTYHILLDMDDTTFDLQTPWVKWVTENGDPEFSSEKIKTWNWHIHTSIGRKVYDFLQLPGIFLDLEPLPDAIQTITRLKNKGHRIQFCTSPPDSPTAKSEKIECLKHHFKWFNPEKDIIFSHDKPEVPGDILFDDRPKWCFEFPGIAICMDGLYNRDFPGYRVTSWKEFEALIDKLSKYSPPIEKGY